MRSSSAGVEHNVGGRKLAVELLHRARPDDRRSDSRVLDHEGDRQLDQRHAGLLGELRELLRPPRACAGSRAATCRSDRRAAVERGRRRASCRRAPAARQPAAGERAAGDDAHAVTLSGGQHVGSIPRTSIEYGGCSVRKRSQTRLRAAHWPRRSDRRGSRTSRCSGPCPGGRGRSARRASPRCRCPGRDGGSGRGRSSRCPGAAASSRPRVMIQRRELPRWLGSSPIGTRDLGGQHDVVAAAPAAPCRRSPRTRRRSRRRRCR